MRAKKDRSADLERRIWANSKDAAHGVVLLNPGHETLVVVLSEQGFRKFRSRAVCDEDQGRMPTTKGVYCAGFACSVQKAWRNDLLAQWIAPIR